MTSYDDVYRAFGFAAESAQRFEDAVAQVVLGQGFFVTPNTLEASLERLHKVQKLTLGQLLPKAQKPEEWLEALDHARITRNHLMHRFYIVNTGEMLTEEGRVRVLDRLAAITKEMQDAWGMMVQLNHAQSRRIFEVASSMIEARDAAHLSGKTPPGNRSG